MIEKYVFAKLSADATLTAITPRIYASRAVQEQDVPFVVFSRVGADRKRSVVGPNGMTNVTIQIDSYADEYGTVKQMADAIRLALDGVKGTAGTVKCQAAALTEEMDAFEDEPVIYRVIQTFSFWFTEALAS